MNIIRAAWLEQRRKGIGGSDIGAILGMSTWGTPYSVWLEKTGAVPPKEETPAMHFGRVLEQAIAEMYMNRVGRRLTKIEDSIPHPLYPECRCTPDYVDLENPETPILSIKYAPYSYGKWGEEGTDDIPKPYLLQSLWEMEIFNRASSDVAVSFGKPEYKLYHVYRDVELGAWLIEQGRAWWKTHIIDGVEPLIDGSDGAAEYITRRFPRNVEPLKIASDATANLLLALAAERKTIAIHEERKALLENQVKLFIGDAAGIESDGFRATWKNSKDGSKTDWELLATEMMGEFKIPAENIKARIRAYTELKPGVRRFLLTQKGE